MTTDSNVVPIGAATAAQASRGAAMAAHPAAGPVPPSGRATFAMGSDATITIERTTSGGLRVSSPDAPGWSTAVTDRVSLMRAIDDGFREAAIAAYARAKAQPYDVALHDQAAEEASLSGKVLPLNPVARERMMQTLACSVGGPVLGATTEPGAVHDPLAWRPLADGRWVSPSGRTYGAGTQVVQRVMEKRSNMGVGTTVQV